MPPVLHPSLLCDVAEINGRTNLVTKYSENTPPCFVPFLTENLSVIWPSYWPRYTFLCFYSAVTLLAMQSAVIATAIPSVRLSVCPSHAGTLSKQIKIGSCGLHYEVAKAL